MKVFESYVGTMPFDCIDRCCEYRTAIHQYRSVNTDPNARALILLPVNRVGERLGSNSPRALGEKMANKGNIAVPHREGLVDVNEEVMGHSSTERFSVNRARHQFRRVVRFLMDFPPREKVFFAFVRKTIADGFQRIRRYPGIEISMNDKFGLDRLGKTWDSALNGD